MHAPRSFGTILAIALIGLIALPSLARSQIQPTPGAITVQTNLGKIARDAVVKFAPDGRTAAIRNSTHIQIWDLQSKRLLRLLEHTAYFEQFTYIAGGTRILSAHKDGEVRVWEVETGKLISSTAISVFEAGNGIHSLWHDADRNLVVLTALRSPIVVWDYQRGAMRAKYDPGSALSTAYGAALSSDGRTLMAGGGNFLVRFDAATGRALETVRLRDKYRVLLGGVLDDATVVATTGFEDCSAGLVLIAVPGATPRYSDLDYAPGCRPTPRGSYATNPYGEITLVHDEAGGHAFLGRYGIATSKKLDLTALRSGNATAFADVRGLVAAADIKQQLAAIRDGDVLRLVRLTDGAQLGVLAGQSDTDFFPIGAGSGKTLMLHREVQGGSRLTVWPLDGVSPTTYRVALPAGYTARHAAPDGNVTLAADERGNFVLVANSSGAQLSRFTVPGIKSHNLSRLSSDGRYALIEVELQQTAQGHWGTTNLSSVLLVDTKIGKVLQQFKERRSSGRGQGIDSNLVRGFGFAPGSKRFALGWQDGTAESWSIDPVKQMKRTGAGGDTSTILAFSPDSRFLVGGSRDEGAFLWSLESGRLVRTLDRTRVAGHVSTGSIAVSHDSKQIAAGPLQRAVSSGDVGRERRVHVWDLASGRLTHLLSGHEANVNAITFTENGRWLVTGSNDGSIRYWHRDTGKIAATFATAPDGRWVIVTEKGFFAASIDAGELLSVVRGLEAVGIEQMWQSLYAPDLVREHLAGDPNGEVKTAAEIVDLDKVLASGPSPTVELAKPAAAVSTEELIDVDVRVTDRGKGVGRIEWRLNGVTAAVLAKPETGGPVHAVSRQIALDPGDNLVEVVAYNGSNLIASAPTRISVKLEARASTARPVLHVLAVGINAYKDKGWAPSPDAQLQAFPPLSLAVSDASAIAEAFKRAAGEIYSEVRVTQALDERATAEGLQQIIESIGPQIHPRDTFVFFAAAHGYSRAGRFYLIPQDYDGGTNPDALRDRAIGQDRLQDWVANHIKAKRAIIMLDTCESGALVAGYSRSRTNTPSLEAAVGRLHEATGRPVLTAAAEGKPAFEGYEGHGVFTWAILDALKNGDRDGNGTIELLELVAHAQNQVPEIAAKLDGRGVATATSRGTSGQAQSARFGSKGEDFVLFQRLN